MAVILITSCDTSLQYNVDYGGAPLNPGSVYSMTFTGGTPSGCYTYNGVGTPPSVDSVFSVAFTVFGDCATCQASLTTPTPTPTPTLTQTPTISGVIYQYYLSGCCANTYLQITSTTNLNVGFATVTNAFYYVPSYTSGVAYFNSSGLMVSTGATSAAVDYTNYILTTDNSGVPTWTSTIEGGSY